MHDTLKKKMEDSNHSDFIFIFYFYFILNQFYKGFASSPPLEIFN